MADDTTGAAVATPAPDDAFLSDDALAEIFGTPEADAEAEPEPGAAPAEPAKELPKEEPKPETVADPEIDLTQLDDDKAGLKTDAPTPAVDPESAFTSELKQWIPNKQMLGTVVDGFQKHAALDTALQKGDLRGVVQALGPNTERLMEAMYQTYKDQLVDRYIAEQTGQTKAAPDPRVAQLESQLAEVTKYLNTGIQQQQHTVQQQTRDTQMKSINDTIDDYFERTRFPKDDRHTAQRELIRKATLTDLAMKGTFNSALGGDKRVIRDAFKVNLENFIKADKPKQVAADAARQTQTVKPAPVQAGASAAAIASDGAIDAYQEAANFVAKVQRRGKR